MAKIILALNNQVLREIPLAKPRVTIGRAPHNDIVIDDRAVSAKHAAIVTTNDESFLEDLNSTNGTQVNGQPVRTHFLQDNDVIELARYRLAYVATPERHDAASAGRLARIKVMTGPNAGKETLLTKHLITLGRPENQVAVVAQKGDAYYLTHVEGASYPLVNDAPIGASPRLLLDGDLIELAGTRLQFLIK
jgi:FHA domain